MIRSSLSERMLTACRRWRPALRMGWRDARRHLARTVFSLLLVVVPVAALIAGLAVTTALRANRQQALDSIPPDAQGVITATAVRRGDEPFPQLPEGAPGVWVDDLSQQPATVDELQRIIPPEATLLPFWKSPDLLATTATSMRPGEQSAAGEKVSAAAGKTDIAATSVVTMTEAGAEALDQLLPTPSSGSVPRDATELVVTTGLAEQLHLRVGDTITITAPPFQGYMSTDGRIGDVIEDSQRAWRVSGLVDDAGSHAWGLEGWMSRMVEQDPLGVDGHYLVMGSGPVTWAQAKSMNVLQAFVVSRHVLTDGYPPADQRYPVRIDAQAALAQAVAGILTTVLGVVVVLFLVTPAFSVSTDQQRRTLGLAAACGASPRDLKRIVTSQGLIIGLCGGLIGTLLGFLAMLVAVPPLRHISIPEVFGSFPWPMMAAVIAMAIIIGYVATLMPARRVGRLNPVEALKDLPAAERHGRGRMHAAAQYASGPALLVAAVACGAASLALPTPAITDGDVSGGGGTSLHMTLLVVTVVLALAALVQLVRGATAWGSSIGRRAPLALRLACRDAANHPHRFVPAATAVLVTIAIASYSLVLIGSALADQRDNEGLPVTGRNHMALFAKVPISNDYDRMVVTDAIGKLRENHPIVDHHPIYAAASPKADYGQGNDAAQRRESQRLLSAKALLPQSEECQGSLTQDVASVIHPGTPVACTDVRRGYRGNIAGLGLVNADVEVLIIDGDAMRDSGYPNADAAAKVLDEGGIVVNNAAQVVDGATELAVEPRDGDIPSRANADRIVTLRSVFVRGFYPLAMSGKTARELGFTEVRYIGEYVSLAGADGHGLPGFMDMDGITAAVDARYPLVGTSQDKGVWVVSPITFAQSAMLALLALAATLISLLLARTQTRRDLSTMHAVGASPRFLRRFGLAQAAVILLTGVPGGMAAGLALGWFHVAWNRRIGADGAWLRTDPIWPMQLALAIAVTLIALAMAYLVTRPARDLTRRSID